MRTIYHPQGGRTELDYAYKESTVDMPQGKYVLSEVTRSDGMESGDLGYESVHRYTTTFDYEDGYYDRVEKESYGFGKTYTYSPDDTTSLTVTRQGLYHLKGMSDRQKIWNAGERWSSETITSYGLGAPYALPTETQTTVTEKEGTITSGVRYAYDRFGNVTKITDTAEGTDTLEAVIEYGYDEDRYFVAHPRRITVESIRNGKRSVIRERSGSYHSTTGALIEQTAYDGRGTDKGGPVTTSIERDAYGNIAKIHNGAWVEYRWDSVNHQYPVTIRRGGPSVDTYTSSIDWDYRQGVKIQETDENGREMTYAYDNYGRLTKVFSPYDTTIPAIAYRYEQPLNGRWYAVTENKVRFDPADNAVIRTVIVADGLGRALVTGKDGVIRENGADIAGWTVSGGIAYDNKGRKTAQGQGGFERIVSGDGIDLLRNYRYPLGLINPTKTSYDTQDRTIAVKLPDNSPPQTTSYRIENARTIAASTDPLGNVSEQESDARGNIVEVRRFDAYKVLLTRASYDYNAIGEMLKAIDAQGFVLSVEYDTMGRRTALESKDIGRKEYYYDRYGNLKRESDSVLRGKGAEIVYEYDGMNRLIKINYPESEDTVYTYGGASEAEKALGQAGRIKKL